MTLVLLIVLPCAVVGAAVVVVLDHVGVLPRWEGGAATGRTQSAGDMLERVPRAAIVAGAGLMGAWILAWLVLLVIGLGILAS